MAGTEQKVSTLLMTVGRPHRPFCVGKGGRSRGQGHEALQRVQQRRLLAADVGAEAARDLQVKGERAARGGGAAKRSVADEAGGLRLSDGRVEDVVSLRVLVAEVDDAGHRANDVGGDGHGLDEQVRVEVQQRAVLEGAGLALVGVADDVLQVAGGLADGLPLRSEGEARAAASKKAAGAQGLEGVGGGVLLDEALQTRVAAIGAVDVKGAEAGRTDVAEEDLLHAVDVGRRRRRESGMGRRSCPSEHTAI